MFIFEVAVLNNNFLDFQIVFFISTDDDPELMFYAEMFDNPWFVM